MCVSKRSLLLSGVGLILSLGAARGLTPPLYDIPADDLRRALERGATFVGYLDDLLFVERYEPDGRLRGTYAGRAYQGRWRQEGANLCTEVAPAAPLCVMVRGSTSGPMADGLHLWLLPTVRGTAMSATYRTRPPWETRSPQMTVRVRMLSPGADSFAAMGSVEGLPQYFTVWTGRRLSADRQQDILVHGTTDGVTFTAERVTHLDGAPLP
jgi:hypothetical protein